MTLKELLNEEHYIDVNYYVVPDDERDKSVISGKTILGFPGNKEHVPVNGRKIFNVANVGDNVYEFYVGDYKYHANDMPYKHKEDYVGSIKFSKFKDGTGISLTCIRKFINSKKLDDQERNFLYEYYNKHREHPYYKGYFEKI